MKISKVLKTAIGIIVAVSVIYVSNFHLQTSNLIEDVTKQNGFIVFNQIQRNIHVTFNKVDIPTDFDDYIEFGKEEVIGYKTETTSLYLESISYDELKADYLVLTFNFSYDIEEDGTLTVPYKVTYDGDQVYYAFSTNIASTELQDGSIVYEDAVLMNENGPNEKFSVYVEKDAYDSATNIVSLSMTGFYDITYSKE